MRQGVLLPIVTGTSSLNMYGVKVKMWRRFGGTARTADKINQAVRL